MAITDAQTKGAGAVLLAIGLFLFTAAMPGASHAETAFPGAVGYGAEATGWRGGKLIPVTNLRDSGRGSLRNCVEKKIPRVCVFRVSGTIMLRSALMARSNLYIAGQTAPGDGIQLRNAKSRQGPLIVKEARDVVVRFLKLRPGPGVKGAPNVDGITVENASNLYFGNLSLMFSVDESFNIHVNNGTATDITLADSILAFSLDHSTHPEGRHSKGALICSGDGTNNSCGRISLLRNIFVHHRDRNPDLKGTDTGPIEVVNNIFYDAISQFGEFYDLLGDLQVAYVGNLALRGPSSTERANVALEVFDWTDGNDISVWANDNEARDCETGTPFDILGPDAQTHQAAEPIPTTIEPMPVGELLTVLPERAGDNLPEHRHRDRLDKRALSNLADCSGKVIDHPRAVDGWADIPPSQPPEDSDGDLLPDEWEAGQTGLDPDRADDPWQILDSTGHSAVESWLAELAGDT
ncbi:hypothetical protein FQV27_16085 [Paracoccus aurantiacus]|uniref:Pectate lyase n=1 Tax=Paracoccus aurantiacus TaxID=2599412 RepID=A0A5C6RVN0_9RHOB|nr:hypothetical protein [Paracoccus aurantiacus]TXB66428.1 hypothetical protein FQV27_16085 [Paracoccus aurantiacus]